MAPGPIGAKAKKMQRIVWMPMSQPIPSESESEIFFTFAFARSALALTIVESYYDVI